MFKDIIFVILFTVCFSWALNLNTLSQILPEKNQRKIASILTIVSGFLLSLIVLFWR